MGQDDGGGSSGNDEGSGDAGSSGPGNEGGNVGGDMPRAEMTVVQLRTDGAVQRGMTVLAWWWRWCRRCG